MLYFHFFKPCVSGSKKRPYKQQQILHYALPAFINNQLDTFFPIVLMLTKNDQQKQIWKTEIFFCHKYLQQIMIMKVEQNNIMVSGGQWWLGPFHIDLFCLIGGFPVKSLFFRSRSMFLSWTITQSSLPILTRMSFSNMSRMLTNSFLLRNNFTLSLRIFSFLDLTSLKSSSRTWICWIFLFRQFWAAI